MIKSWMIRAAACFMASAVLLGSQYADSSEYEEVIFYHNNALGSPIAATDASGNVLWQEEYSPYGSRLQLESRETECSSGICTQVESPWDEKQWFTGKIEETSLGIQYFGARWYEPEIGRFLSVDPVQFTESNIFSFNRYTYANNNPYRYIDPDGESPVDLFFLAVDVAKFGVAVYKGTGVGAAAVDVGFSLLGVVSPVPGLGQAAKAGKFASVAKGVGKADNAPDFVVSPGGTAFPVPKGATGPTPVVNPAGKKTGDAFTGGSGGANGQVDTMRMMDPTPPRGNSPGYPNGYIKYENKSGQGVDPYTGRTLSNKDSHFPID